MPRPDLLRPLIALAVLASTLVCPSLSQGQQAQAAADSSNVAIGPATALSKAGISRPTARKHDKLPFVFYGVLGAGAVTAAALRVDPDTGGYRDGWRTETDFPDKAVHALAAWALTNVGVDLGVRPSYSAGAVCAAGTAFEFAQGYVSIYDIAADCVGAATAAAWQRWRAKRRALAAAKNASIR
jgi:hypothetical protein